MVARRSLRRPARPAPRSAPVRARAAVGRLRPLLLLPTIPSSSYFYD
jgi:hypothetical protein